MALDFSLLGQGPQFGNVLAAYDAGRERRREADRTNALALYATNPEQGIKAVTKIDPILGMKLQDDLAERQAVTQRKQVFAETDPAKRTAMAQQTGDPAVIEAVGKLDTQQRALAKEKTDALGAFAYGLRQKPYEQRKAILQQAVPALQGIGITPAEIAAVDPTDDYLDSQIFRAQGLAQMIEQTDKERRFQLDKSDKEADNLRAQRQFEETQRHNKASEGISAGNLGVSQGNLAQRRKEHEARVAGKGGYAAPGVVFNPNEIQWDNR